MLKSSLCDYSDGYILVKGTITVDDTPAAGAAANNTNKKVILKNCAPLTNCINRVNNTQTDNATDSFNSKAKITGQTDDDGEIDNFEIMVLLKYLSNFWRTLEMPLMNCEVNLILTWYENCVIVSTNVTNEGAIFAILKQDIMFQ